MLQIQSDKAGSVDIEVLHGVGTNKMSELGHVVLP